MLSHLTLSVCRLPGAAASSSKVSEYKQNGFIFPTVDHVLTGLVPLPTCLQVIRKDSAMFSLVS